MQSYRQPLVRPAWVLSPVRPCYLALQGQRRRPDLLRSRPLIRSSHRTPQHPGHQSRYMRIKVVRPSLYNRSVPIVPPQLGSKYKSIIEDVGATK